MPLPEEEQRQLQEIERALYGSDPKFVRRMRAGKPRLRYERKLVQVVLWVLIGAGLLSAGVVADRIYLVAAGVMIALLSLVWLVASRRLYVAEVRPTRSKAGTGTATGTQSRAGPTRRARMMRRMEERWRRRQEGHGGTPGRTRS